MVNVSKFDSYHIELLTYKKSVAKNQIEEIDETKLKNRVNITPIEELGIHSTPMDGDIVNNKLKHPLLIEIKELRNVS